MKKNKEIENLKNRHNIVGVKIYFIGILIIVVFLISVRFLF